MSRSLLASRVMLRIFYQAELRAHLSNQTVSRSRYLLFVSLRSHYCASPFSFLVFFDDLKYIEINSDETS